MKFIIRLLEANYKSPILEIEAKDHAELCELIFGRIEIISGEDL